MPAQSDLRGQVIAVAGATGVLGSTLARALWGRGASLILAGRSVDRLEALASDLSGSLTVPGDLRHKVARRLLRKRAEEGGRLDGIFVSVGEADYHALTALEDERIREVIDENLTLPALIVRSLLPALLRRKSGSIVLVASEWGIEPAAGEVPYAAAKAGLIGFTRSLAAELEPSGIRVNALAPGAFESPMLSGLTERGREALLASYKGRLLDVRTIAAEALRLLHPDTKESGRVIPITGRPGPDDGRAPIPPPPTSPPARTR